jgi:N-acetylglucosamine repressor
MEGQPVHEERTRRTTGSRPADVKIENKLSMLQYVYLTGSSSKPAVCRAVGLSKPTASNLIDELIASGVLGKTELGASSDAGGKRPQLFEFRDDAGWVIGIDVDDGVVSGVATDLRLASRAARTRQADDARPELVGRAVAEVAAALIAAAQHAGRPVLAIAVSTPGDLNEAAGGRKANSAGRVSTAAEEALGSLGLSVLAAPAIRNAAVAEAWFGCGPGGGHRSFMVVDTRHGLGTCLVHASPGTPVNASYNLAALGHTTVNLDGPRCWCGNRGCWELYASERAFLEAVRRGAASWHLPSALARDIRDGGPPTVAEVAHHLGKGDEFARTQVEIYADRLATGLVNVANAFNLGFVVLHGGLRPLGQGFLDLMTRQVREVALPPAGTGFDVVFSYLPDDGALLAAASAIRHVLEGDQLVQ